MVTKQRRGVPSWPPQSHPGLGPREAMVAEDTRASTLGLGALIFQLEF